MSICMLSKIKKKTKTKIRIRIIVPGKKPTIRRNKTLFIYLVSKNYLAIAFYHSMERILISKFLLQLLKKCEYFLLKMERKKELIKKLVISRRKLANATLFGASSSNIRTLLILLEVDLGFNVSLASERLCWRKVKIKNYVLAIPFTTLRNYAFALLHPI